MKVITINHSYSKYHKADSNTQSENKFSENTECQKPNIVELIHNFPDDILLQLCKDIYDWDANTNNTIPQNSALFAITNNQAMLSFLSINEYRKVILAEASTRYAKIVSILLRSNPSLFIK